MSSLRQIYTILADEIEDFASLTTTSAGASTSEAICSDLINSSAGAKHYAFSHLYAQSGALAYQQRGILEGGFAPSTGALTVSNAFTSIPQSGISLALTTRFPVVRFGKRPGLREFINRALETMAVEDRITVSGVTNQPRYDLPVSTQWWINDKRRILGIGSPYPNSTDLRELDPQYFDIIMDGETPQLQLRQPYATGDTFELIVYRPANSRLKMNGHARAVLSTTTVGSISVIAGGYYTSTPTVTLSGGGGTGATATATLTSSTISSIAVTAAGTGYTSPPTVTISAGTWQDMPYPTDGLVIDTDETIALANNVVLCAKEYAYLSMMQFGPAEAVQDWERKYVQQQTKANLFKWDRAPQSGIARTPMRGHWMGPAL